MREGERDAQRVIRVEVFDDKDRAWIPPSQRRYSSLSTPLP